MPQHEECNLFLEDFEKSELGQDCVGCLYYNHHCPGASHKRKDTAQARGEQVAEAVALGISAFVKSGDDTGYKSARYSGALPDSIYSPMSYTPSTEAFFNASEEASHYFSLIRRAISRINAGKHPKDRFHLKFSGGRFEIAKGNFTEVQVNNVATAIALSNIYHVLKAMEHDMEGFVSYLKDNGVPTLVEAIKTGNTPPHDAENFELEGLYGDA